MGMAPGQKNVPEQTDIGTQITALAARSDPVAFRRSADRSLEGRRKLASRSAADRLLQTQTYLGVSVSTAALIGAIVIVIFSAQ